MAPPVFTDDRPHTIVGKTIGSFNWTNEERGWWVTEDGGGWGAVQRRSGLWDLHGPDDLMPQVKPSYRSFKAAAEHAEQLAAEARKGRG